MSRKRRNFSAKFKSDLVIELLKGWLVYQGGGMAQKTSEEICGPDYESKFSPKPFDD